MNDERKSPNLDIRLNLRFRPLANLWQIPGATKRTVSSAREYRKTDKRMAIPPAIAILPIPVTLFHFLPRLAFVCLADHICQTCPKKDFIVAHAPSPNTQRLLESIIAGATSPDIAGVDVIAKRPFDATAEDVMQAQAIILGTTENLGYMSGALKDFFDRIYYPCLEEKQGTPYALYIRAGHDGTGTRRGVETIVTGLRWRAVQEPLIMRGDWQESFVEPCEELGMAMAAGLEAGII